MASWFTLVTGLALPWLLGYLLIQRTGLLNSEPEQQLLKLGLGFFVGCVLIALLLRLEQSITGGVSWNWIALFLSLFAALLFIPRRFRKLLTTPVKPAEITPNSLIPRQGLLVLIALACLLHLVVSALEIISLPVFPWDGWTVWVYRAKAWFYSEALVPMVSTGAWLRASDPTVYTIPATGYPLLPSLMHLWAALSLGEWHETLVNTPIFLCGMAIVLCLGGCLHRSGVSSAGVWIGIYLLLSTPLFGIHMSLGGYADIWMAGFSGIGMTCLVMGLASHDRRMQWIGLAMLTIGLLVKVEGFVWLAAGLGVLLLARLPVRLLLALFVAGLILGIIGWLTGVTWVNIPGLGKIGFQSDGLLVPVKGIIEFERYEVGPAYLANAFFLGSWHLLWAMALAALLGLFALWRTELGRAGLAFFTVFALTQVLIFGFTAEGAWAQDYTAINRMPLQMLPAVIYLVVTVWSRMVPEAAQRWRAPETRRALVLGAGGALIICMGLLFGRLAWKYGEDSESNLPVSGETLSFMAGGGARQNDGIRVDRYDNGIAVLSSGLVRLDAHRFRLLNVDLDFDRDIASLDLAPAFFWRRAGQLTTVSRYTLQASGLIDLSSHEDWQGEIIEFGFFFPENHGEPVVIRQAELQSLGLAQAMQLVPRQWWHFDTWTQRSAHWKSLGVEEPLTSLTGWVLLFSLLGGGLAYGFRGRADGLLCFGVLMFSGWLLLDARWLLDRGRQGIMSAQALMTQTVDQRIAADELGEFYPFLQRLVTEELGSTPKRIVLLADSDLHKYFGLRSKYQLLPHSVSVQKMMPHRQERRTVDYVLYLGSGNLTPGTDLNTETRDEATRRLGIMEQHRRGLFPEITTEQGTLFRVVGARRDDQ